MNLENLLDKINSENIIEWITKIEERYCSLKEKIRQLNFDVLPKPASRKPSYFVGNEEKTLEELTEKELEPITEQAGSVLNLNGFQVEERNMIARTMAILNSAFWDFEEKKAKKRKYEQVPSLTHLLSVAGMLENPCLIDLLVSLNHDTVEDSYRHKVLKKYYNGEDILKEDAYLVRLNDDELKIKDKRRKRQIYNIKLSELIDNTVNLIGVNDEIREQVKIYLDAFTKRVYESYETYIKRVVKKATRLKEEGYILILAKAYDRIDNSHFNPSYDEQRILNDNAKKVLKDAVKNVFVLEAISAYLNATNDLEKEKIEELLKVKLSLGALLNKNMLQLRQYIRKNYGSIKLRIYGENKNLEYWCDECEKELSKYYEEGGFNKRDVEESSTAPEEIFKYKGSITSLSRFIEEKEKKRHHLFENLNDALDILKLYKFCAVAKAIGCLSAMHNPFVNEGLTLDNQYGLSSLGFFDPNLLTYQISGVVI